MSLLLGSSVGVAALRLSLSVSIVHGLSRAEFLDGTALAFAFAALLLAIGRWDGNVAALRPLQACGIMCYSVYLTHQPVIMGVRVVMGRLGLDGGGPTIAAGPALAAVTVSVAVGWCFFQLVERHFLNTPTNTNLKTDVPRNRLGSLGGSSP